MRYLLVILLAMHLVGCGPKTKKIRGTNLEQKIFELNVKKKTVSSRNYKELFKEITNLNQYIGMYPPRFKNEEEREVIYQKWLDLVADAEAFATTTDKKEGGYYLLAELYRQGHNMDVRGSANKAKENLNSCLSPFPKSVLCNLSASYLYLSIAPPNLSGAEKSLNTLRKVYSPEFNSEVEAGYVFLYLYQENFSKANAQIDKYLYYFPDGSRAEDFVKIKSHLGEAPKKITSVTNNDELNYFVETYYMEPHPELVDSALQFINSSGLANNENAIAPILMTFSCIFDLSSSGQKEKWREKILELNPPAKTILLRSINQTPDELLNNVETSPAKNDMYWSSFFITGEQKYLDAIIATLGHLDERKDLMLFLTAASAKWSLSSNAKIHKKVRDALEDLKTNGDAKLKPIAEEILINNPGKINTETQQIIESQKLKGVW